MFNKLESVGIVVIGRNEGNRLKASLLSMIEKVQTIVYVDSGSTDGSVEFARSLGINVVELDLSTPFTAARARNAGFEYLKQVKPEIEFVQFVDGDCQLRPGWLERALSELLTQPDVVVVFGRLREEFPERSIYNRLCDIEWDTPVGEAKYCGGIAMMRSAAFQKASGFNPALIAGEEPELCVRLRQAGGRILRVDAEMALHNAEMIHFYQWWRREVRNGHAYAEGAWLHGRSPQRHWVRESLRSWFWALLLPMLAVTTALLTKGLSILLLFLAYAYLICSMYFTLLKRGYKSKDAILYGLFGVLQKFPKLQGQIKFHLSQLFKKQPNIIEYKSLGSFS